MVRPLALALLLPLAAWPPGPARAGDLEGVIQLRGTPPPTAPMPVSKDGHACGASVPDETLQVKDGRVANAVVTAAGAPLPAAAQPPPRLTLDQKGCRFVPHVQVAPPGATLEVLNSDPVLHSVHGWQGLRTRFDAPMPRQGERTPVRLDHPGVIQVRCDIHGWMSAYVVVTEGPAAVTGADGRFALRGLPAGTYLVTAWHERLGERTAQVAVPAKGTAQVTFTFGE